MGFFPQGTALGAVLSLQLQPFFTHNFYVKEITAEIVLYYTILAKVTLAPGCLVYAYHVTSLVKAEILRSYVEFSSKD